MLIIKSVGINIHINVAITINGPNGMYSLAFFILNITNTIPTIAPTKNAINEIINVFVNPKIYS